MKYIFLFSLILLVPLSPAFAYEVIFDMNQESYQGGDTVDISGNVEGKKQGDLVAIEIKDTEGTTIVIRTVELGPSATFTLNFKLPRSYSSGAIQVATTTSDSTPELTNIESTGDSGGGCLIATAAYGTEMAPQVQLLREIRDNKVMSTSTGTAFMNTFNSIYYSFSPYIADMERENSLFQEAIRLYITPMISTLSIMTLADNGNDIQVLGLGISIIALNLGMYFGAPFGAFIIYRKLKN